MSQRFVAGKGSSWQLPLSSHLCPGKKFQTPEKTSGHIKRCTGQKKLQATEKLHATKKLNATEKLHATESFEDFHSALKLNLNLLRNQFQIVDYIIKTCIIIGNNREPVPADHVEWRGAEEHEVDHQGDLPHEPRQLPNGHTGLPRAMRIRLQSQGSHCKPKVQFLGKVDNRYMTTVPQSQGDPKIVKRGPFLT